MLPVFANNDVNYEHFESTSIQEFDIVFCIDTFNEQFMAHHGETVVDVHEGFTLTWQNIGDRFILESVQNEYLLARFEYDNQGNRVRKEVNGVITEFFYEDNILMRKIYRHNEVIYVYDNRWILTGVIINGEAFDYLFDSYGRIVGLVDAFGAVVVEHQYNHDLLLLETRVIVNGEFVNATTVPNEIVLLNGMVGTGQYLDVETGWYYYNGRFFNPNIESFIPTPFVEIPLDRVSPRDPFSDAYNRAITMINTARANPNFGRPIAHSTGWHNSLTELEVFARMIHGEAVTRNEVVAIGYVASYRRQAPGYGGNTFAAVVRASGQFAAITSTTASNTQHARNPSGWRWDESVRMAAFAIASGNTSILSGVISKPAGYTNQLYFLESGYFVSRTREVTSFSNGTGVYNRGGQGVWHRIRNISDLGSGNRVTGNIFFNYQ